MNKHLEGIPDNSEAIGYARLAADLNLACPVRQRSAVSNGSIKGGIRKEGDWFLVEKRLAVGPDLIGHLDYALRREALDLLVLKKAFAALSPAAVSKYVANAPLGQTERRAWFLYEWLTGNELDVPDLKSGNYLAVLDPDEYHALPHGRVSVRHRMRDNLPGNRSFCPISRRVPGFDSGSLEQATGSLASAMGIGNRDTLRRASGHLLLADSRSSFLIEGEKPPVDKLKRWASTLGVAGQADLSVPFLEGLQAQVVGDDRFVEKGLRSGSVYLGHVDRWHEPVPEFIGARPEDLRDLVDGMIAYDKTAKGSGYDPVALAAGLSFGFVYVHPFEDGNGRLHRYLMHHALVRSGFVPSGVVVPISNAIERRMDDYRDVLRAHSAPLMDYIPWGKNAHGNLVVTGDTSDLYRYPDVTEQGRFLAECLTETLGKDLPDEIQWIERFDKAKSLIGERIELPSRKIDDFVMFMRQNDWKLSAKRRKKEFAQMTDDEVQDVEAIVRDAFEVEDASAAPVP